MVTVGVVGVDLGVAARGPFGGFSPLLPAAGALPLPVGLVLCSGFVWLFFGVCSPALPELPPARLGCRRPEPKCELADPCLLVVGDPSPFAATPLLFAVAAVEPREE